MSDRRKFIKTTSYVAAGSLIVPALGCDRAAKTSEATTESAEIVPEVMAKNIGVQAYSVRDALGEDFAGTMKKLADIGYKYIEAYGLEVDGKLLGMDPTEYRKVVEDLGMEMLASHCSYFTADQAEQMRDASLAAGIKYLIIPYLNDTMRSDYSAVADNLNQIGEALQGSGLIFGYHNHDFEFQPTADGRIPMEILIEETQPDLVTFEADLYWVTKGGTDPMELINKYPGRFNLFHVKDANEALEQTTVGSGIVDFATILKAQEISGWQYYFVEDERTDDPFGNLKGAFDYLNQADFG